MKFAERESRRHQDASPHHRADTGQPEFNLQDRGGIHRGRQGGLFRNCRLRPSLHPTRLAPAVPLVLGTPQKVMLSWSVEVTFREARDHLGLETQRQWSDRAIARTTPYLLGLFSLTALLGSRLSSRTKRAVAAAAWYRKTQPTLADTLAAVRQEIWAAQGFSMSRIRSDSRKLPSRLREGIAYALCHAA